jgi:hypothetical protein
MNKILPILVVGIFVLSGLGAVAVTEAEKEEFKHKIASVSFSQPIIETEKEYVSINIDEANTFLRNDGKPMLPTYIQTFSFPFGTKIKKVTCTLSNFQEKTLSKHIQPSPKIAAVSQQIVKNEEEPIDYGTNPYPSEWFDYDLGCGRTRAGLNVFVKAEVFLVKYYPQEKRIKWASNAEIIVEYEPPSSEPVTFGEEYKFIVLAPDEYSDELAPLITHKNGRGISTIFVSLDDIYDGVYFPKKGRDEQEKIKYFIKNAMENWNTSYVLLVGGWHKTNPNQQKFPVRETHVHIYSESNPNYANETFVSDLYYADIYNETGAFVSWDSNDNDVFGEYDWGNSHNFDEVDLYPDIYLGRLACVNGNEVTTCVNKIIKYEEDASYTLGWFDDIVVIGGDTWVPHSGDHSGIPEGEYIQEHILDAMTGFSPDRIWDTNGRLGTWIYPYGSGDITNTINKGCGFVEWSGHGNLDVWATHRHNGSGSNWIPTPLGAYLNSNIQALSNGNKLPIVVVGGCSCGKFNLDVDCFAWSFLMNSGGGGIATVAASGLLYSAFGEETVDYVAGLIEINMFKAYKELRAITFGEMWAWAIKKYIDMSNLEFGNVDYCYDYKTMEQWQPFGDPTLAIAPESQPPNKPRKPTGKTKGAPGVEYEYTSFTSDPDGDDISYKFNWGDGTYSEWIGPVESWEQVSANHTWDAKGEYNVRVRAKDIHEDYSEWSDPLKVSMPRNRAINTPFQWFLQQHPNLFPILRLLFQR